MIAEMWVSQVFISKETCRYARDCQYRPAKLEAEASQMETLKSLTFYLTLVARLTG